MAGFLLLIFIVLMIFIVIKVNGLKYRAKQGVLNKVGLGSSNINSATDSLLEKGNLKKFLASIYRRKLETVIKRNCYGGC